MRLAEAIRKGATMRPITRETFFRFSARGRVLATCALGAAVEGYVGKLEDFDDTRGAVEAFDAAFSGVLDAVTGPCQQPKCCALLDRTLRGSIVHLNDRHSWTRERIADWLDARDGIPTPAELSA